MRPYEDLANAIIAQAAEDYLSCRREIDDYRSRFPSARAEDFLRVNKGASVVLWDTMTFFKGGWYELLTDYPYDALLRALEPKVRSTRKTGRTAFSGMAKEVIRSRLGKGQNLEKFIQDHREAILEELRWFL